LTPYPWVYTYDSLNRLDTETQPNGDVLDYDYDVNGNKTQLKVIYASGAERIETYTYDDLNRLKTVTDNDQNVTTYEYDDVGNRAAVVRSNGNSTGYQYDSLNRLTQVQEKRADDSVYQQFDYQLHDTGRREKISELGGRVTDYIYDALYRLTDETITDPVNGNYSANYSYDLVGNRTASTINGVSTVFTYDLNDRLIQQGGEIYTYDDNGNTLSKTIDSDVTTYTYDARQKLVDAQILESGVLRSLSYRYNVDGIRTQKVEEGVVTNYLVDSNRDYAQVIAETDTSNTVAVEYIFGDDLLAQNRSGTLSNYHYDGLGSTRALSDSTGNVSDEYFYDAFGVELARTGSTVNDYLFTGEQYDAGLGNYYLRARYYDQGIGRFTQQDTWMGRGNDPVTLHKYLYANVDPVNGIDPTGNFTLMESNIAHNIRSIGVEMTIHTGFALLDSAIDPDNAASNNTNNSLLGLGVMAAGGGAFKLLRLLSPKFRKACNSFTADTLVATTLGLTPISSLEIGDIVLAFDEELGRVVEQPIVHTIQREGDYKISTIELETGEKIDSTDEHPFYVSIDGQDWYWVEAKLLKAGQLLKRENGDPLKIKSVKENEWLGMVYNLTIDKNHSYFVSEDKVLSHNANPNKPCRMPEIDSGLATGMIDARSKVRKLAGLGGDAVPYVATRPSRTAGRVVSGMQSPDGKKGWRLDFDDEKGLHLNWWKIEDGVSWKGYVTIPGKNQNDYWELLDHFPWIGPR